MERSVDDARQCRCHWRVWRDCYCWGQFAAGRYASSSSWFILSPIVH